MGDVDKKKNLDETKSDLPSNEDLVESLVKDVEKSCIKDEVGNGEQSTSELNDEISFKLRGAESISSNDEKSKELSSEEIKEDDDDDEDDDKSKHTAKNDDDFIDEEHLKDLEVDYSEEDKMRLKGEAEELKNEGNSHFKSGEYKEAAISYTKALRICPLAFSKNRAVLYANRGAAKIKLFLLESAIEDCTKAVELDPVYLKAYIRRAQLYEDTDKLDEALADYKKILEIDPLHRDALYASKRLAEQINERNEKLKTEMLGKLKDLGNMFLKPFGLSTNNFQMVQDPNTGGYSINFTQNPNHS